MTFLEAAIEILRNADEPMHFSEVARRAVESNLLSHVGRDPEAAMRSCLNSAVRMGRAGEDPIIMRDKPGYYGIRPGAQLPDPPPRPQPPAAAKKPSDSHEEEDEVKASSRTRTVARKGGRKTAAADEGASRGGGRRGRRVRGGGRVVAEPEEPEEAVEAAEEDEAQAEPESDAQREAAEAPPAVEFEAPVGSGLDGITDVELVMANAVSRLVEERPELRDELDAMQQAAADRETWGSPRGEPSIARRTEDPGMGPRGAHRVRDMAEERSSRRRRRRRRRGKRVDWAGAPDARGSASTAREKLLDQVAKVLEDSGPRSLHVRQVAETLAGQGVLGGEISEIERAVTSAVLLDINLRGRASRFVARGDARYQLQGTRLPEKAAAAEQALRDAVRVLEEETQTQLVQWLHSLGARALESLVRIYLSREGYQLVSAMPPARGVGKLVVDDGEEEGRVLALVVPRRTPVDPKLWDGDAERNGCTSVLLFAMGDPPEDWAEGMGGRCIGAAELAQWLRQNKLAVQQVTIEVSVLDPTVIESIAGLDT